MGVGSLLRTRRRRVAAFVSAVLVFSLVAVSLQDLDPISIRSHFSPNPGSDGKAAGSGGSGGEPVVNLPPGPGHAERSMDYGVSQIPEFQGEGHVVRLGILPKKHVPARGNGKRLIVIGDVHGMLRPLQKLLAKVNFDAESGNDHVVLLGDVINKGPCSAEVVDYAMSIGASAVRGNNEDRVLLQWDAMRNHGEGSSRAADDEDVAEDEDEDGPNRQRPMRTDAARGDPKDKATALGLKHRHIKWLAKRPVILKAAAKDPVEGFGDLVFVHAGLVPGVDLDRQDPWAVMNMRSLVYPRSEARRSDAKNRVELYVAKLKKEQEEEEKLAASTLEKGLRFLGTHSAPDPPRIPSSEEQKVLVDDEIKRTTKPKDHDVMVPVEGRQGDPWSDVWNQYQRQEQLEGKDPDRVMSVVYGHDARRGLDIQSYTFGLDSGCVYGRELTAMVISGSPDGVTHEIVQVKCKSAHKQKKCGKVN